MNRLYPSGKHPEAVTRQIIRCYAFERTIKQVAKRVGMSERQIVTIYGAIQDVMAVNWETLERRHKSTQAWEVARQEYRKTMKRFIGAKGLDALVPKGETQIDYADIQKKFDAMDTCSAREILDKLSDDDLDRVTEGMIHSLCEKYVGRKVRARRGMSEKRKKQVEEEARYRFVILSIYKNRQKQGSKPRIVRLSSFIVNVIYKLSIFDVVYAPTAEQANIIEADVIRIVEQYPLGETSP